MKRVNSVETDITLPRQISSELSGKAAGNRKSWPLKRAEAGSVWSMLLAASANSFGEIYTLIPDVRSCSVSDAKQCT